MNIDISKLPTSIKCRVRKTIFNRDSFYIVSAEPVPMSLLPSLPVFTLKVEHPGIVEGETILAGTGVWEIHRDSPQFVFKTLEFEDELSDLGMDTFVTFISKNKFPGVGAAIATKIYEIFGERTVEVLDGRSEFENTRIPGLPDEKKAQFLSKWVEMRSVLKAMAPLNKLGLSASLSMQVIKKYGLRTMDVIAKDPYSLYRDIDGIGFVKADDIALKMGMAKYSVERMKALVRYHLEEARDSFGDTCVVRKDLANDVMEYARSTLGLRDEDMVYSLLVDAFKEMDRSGETYTTRGLGTPDGPSSKYISLASCFKNEYRIAESLLDRVHRPADDVSETLPSLLAAWESENFELDPHQRRAVTAAFANRVVVITGGPGTGKTTIQKAIVSLYVGMGKSVRMAAPTGKAAARMPQVSGQKGCTIHRLLGYSPDGGFVYSSLNRIPGHVFVVDEFSMVDAWLASKLFDALPDDAILVMVGDVDQLPSVGAGNVFQDIIDSGVVPVVRLEHIFRQADGNDIAEYASKINNGEFLDDVSGKNFHPICCYSDGEAKARLQRLIEGELHKYVGDFDMDDVQVLSPAKKESFQLSTTKINDMLQDMLNPRPDNEVLRFGSSEFRVGDRVMQTRNDYDKGVFNGDQGEVVSVDVKDRKLIVDFGDSGVKEYASGKVLSDLVLSYVCTIHKSQGNEYPIVIVLLGSSMRKLFSRNLLYTAVTRAKRHVILLDSDDSLNACITKRAIRRSTRLMYMLRNLGWHTRADMD